jgi:8-oxo-dGTP pyrophosphatase MutT (NUDIX family)
VAEETGVQAQVLAPLGTIEYWFVADGHRIHKTVHHFLLCYESGALSTDDVEVDEVAWAPIDTLASRLAHASERSLLDRLPEVLAGNPR